MEKETDSKCKIEKKLDFNKINENLKKDYPIKQQLRSKIMQRNLDKLGIRYRNE